ncbi:flavin-containing monooxygenase [Zavarzinia sp. CC-PAN008]|uniref:flavin-containing monooxygenase n=1 Tax=Zavarzinia sp. CC-PAN008 TaxID=3243332 RepID=UPI003F747B27
MDKTIEANPASGAASGKGRRILIIGAGPGGLCAGIKLAQAGHDNFTILEKGTGVGGTWYHNRYPGAACDVQSHLYSFSFELNPGWSETYSGQKEIRAYMERVAEKYGMLPRIRFRTEVVRAVWDEAAAVWRLTLAGGEVLEAEVVIASLGMFNDLNRPNIPGEADFRGTLFHSADWPHDLDLRDKRIGVIGSAASAVQFIPELAKVARHLTVFQRSANWVLPKEDRVFSDQELAAMKADPTIVERYRQELYDSLEGFITFSNPDALKAAEEAGLANLAQVQDPATREKMRPQGPFGCQRPLISNHYYPTFNRPNVELVTEAITRVTPTGIETADGTVRNFDVIIQGTGFAATRYLAAIDVVGRGGKRLEDAWKDGAEAYLGMTTTGFPNLFMLYGPNTNNGSIIFMLECQVAYILRQLDRLQNEYLAWLDVKPQVQSTYNQALQHDLATVGVWKAGGCSNYYRSSTGKIVTQWPHTMTEYKARTTRPDPEAFEAAPLATVA